MPFKSIGIVPAILMLLAPTLCRSGETPDLTRAGNDYAAATLPLLKQYCLKCHSTAKQEGDLDLERFATFDQVRSDQRAWQKVAEMLDNGEMPPKEARQLKPTERSRLREWVRVYLDAEATARAGDPGKVVLRRLSNSEYTYTLRDLTGIDSLDPAREFPVDGAAGEGFTNTGSALVMSPALVTKYLDSAKEIASHAVLLPDGIRFSPKTTPRDWTEEKLEAIRAFYRSFTDQSGGDKVNLQGIVFDTNQGGRLPLEKYFIATLAERRALNNGTKTIEQVARERGLNSRYLGTLWKSLNDPNPSLLIGGLSARWKAAKVEQAGTLTAEVAAWQKGLWTFSTVGHIGKVGGPKAWMEPIDPLIAKQDVRFKVPASPDGKDITVSLVALDAGDGNDHDVVVWQTPRLVAPGRPDVLLRDLREVSRELVAKRERIFAKTTRYLDAADSAIGLQGEIDIAELARKHDVEADPLRAWLNYLGIATSGVVELRGHFTTKLLKVGDYDFVKGWGRAETPNVLANSSGQTVRIPGGMGPHGILVHPSPEFRTAIGWRSPVSAKMRLQGSVNHALPECGHSMTWRLELRRGTTRSRLATGLVQGGKKLELGPIEDLEIRSGDFVSLLIAHRDGRQFCDSTAVDLQLTRIDDPKTVWNLAADVSGDILAGNPHADRSGNPAVWHFYTEPDEGGSESGPAIPANSLLARWRTSRGLEEKHALAEAIQKLLTSSQPAPKESPDGALFRQLASLGGPLLGPTLRIDLDTPRAKPETQKSAPASHEPGLDPALFGKHPAHGTIDPSSLCVRAPSVVTFQIPAELANGAEVVTTGILDPALGAEGSVQLEIVAGKPPHETGLLPSEVRTSMANGLWTSDNRRNSYATPIIVNEKSAARTRTQSALDDFRNLFPAALCYTKIVPVDEVVTLTLYYREDAALVRLMLDETQKARLDRLWDELHYISHDALTLVDAYGQLMEYATQDADPKVFEPLRKPINDRAAAFRQRLSETEPKHLDALIDFAGKVYRRPLTGAERDQLRQLYRSLRNEEIPHDEAIRLTLARMLVAPAFLYRIEKPGPGAGQKPVSNDEFANRLSYFLWASQPDEALRQLAASGRLTDPETLVAETRRMLRDLKARRLATEFACHWLHIADFDRLDEKSDRLFPSFLSLRGAMYEESIQFFTDLFQNDRSVLNILDADYTFLNEPLSKHYGIPLEKSQATSDWRRVDGVKKYGRGGILAQSTTLATQSGASRTSPTLRGNWISEVLLGERLPRPPKGVPVIPDDESATAGLTVRQLVEKHSSDPKCMVCHQRVDPMGFALEAYDAIGRLRTKDLGDRPIDTHVKTMDGTEFEGLDGLRLYLASTRREAFLRQFCRKLLGYALGRSVQLSDEPLLATMQSELKAHDYRVDVAIEAIVLSRPFREIRGKENAYVD